MSWLSRKYKNWKFNKDKLADLEKHLIELAAIARLRDEHLLFKDAQLANKEQEAENIASMAASNYAAMTAMVLQHNGELVLDRIFIDAVNGPNWNQVLLLDVQPDGSLRFHLQESGTPPENPMPESPVPTATAESPVVSGEGSFSANTDPNITNWDKERLY